LPASDSDTTEAQSILEEKSELLTGQGELILVVDDEDAIRQMTKLSLESSGYKVLTANDGIEAVALYAQYKEDISVVVTDMMMPTMDGTTTIRTLKRMNPQVKIIAVSGLTSQYKISEVAADNVKSFLLKPYTGQELLKTLQGVISKN